MMNKKRIGLKDLRNARAAHQAFACLTAYDASFARLMETAGVDLILVGDSLGMVIQGHSTTLPVTVEELHYHCSCVVRATERAMIMVDMPFLSDITLEEGLRNAKHLMQAGAQVIKIEAGMRQIELVRGLSECGIAVCVHLGLRPQQVHKSGTAMICHDDLEAVKKLKQELEALLSAGADLVLLECVSASLGSELTSMSRVPVIGIGAGQDCAGQILVAQDMLGMSEFLPYFAQNFLTAECAVDKNMIQAAFKAYVEAVKSNRFPAPSHCR